MKVLLITNGSNKGSSSSWTLFTKFLKYFQNQNKNELFVIRFSPDWLNSKSFKYEKIYSTFLFSGLLVSLISKFFPNYLLFVSRYYSKKYNNRLIKYINYNKIEKIWVYCDVLPVFVLSDILKRQVINYHVSIFDNPFSVNYNNSVKRQIYPIFKSIINQSSSIDVTIDELLLQIKSQIFLDDNKPYAVSMAGVFKEPEFQPVINKNVKRICLAGSIFGIDALNEFLLSCSKVMIEESIQFDVYSTFSNYHIAYIKKRFPLIENNLKFFDFIDENSIVSKLQFYDLLYLPLFFGNEKLNQSMSSFPSKLHNYLASGIPIIFHVPKFSALYNYVISNNIGFLISSLNNIEILNIFMVSLKYQNRIKLSDNIVSFNKKVANNFHLRNLENLLFYN